MDGAVSRWFRTASPGYEMAEALDAGGDPRTAVPAARPRLLQSPDIDASRPRRAGCRPVALPGAKHLVMTALGPLDLLVSKLCRADAPDLQDIARATSRMLHED